MARGDRKDGRLLRELDALHYVTGIIYPNRCDNEAFISETIDLTNINKYLKKKNVKDIDYKYNLFQIIVTALSKTITLRPKLNRFIVNGNFYQRNDVCASFVIKKEFKDSSEEALAFLHLKDTDNINTIHEEIKRQVKAGRSEVKDASSEGLDLFNKMPRFLSKFLLHIVMWLDKHGWVPQSLIDTDPYYSSVVLSNVGSIKMKSGYHHLTNWGTCSMMMLIGQIKKRPIYDDKGNVKMVETVDLGITLDERLADGYYYSRSIQLLKKLLENPELLEEDLSKEVDF